MYRMPVHAVRSLCLVIGKFYAAIFFRGNFVVVMVQMDMSAMGGVVCFVMDVRMGIRQRRFMMMSAEQDDRRVGELCVDMRMVAARMCVVERANLRQPKRQYEDAEQGDHESPRPDCLFSEGHHVALTLLPPERVFSSSLRMSSCVWMLADSMFLFFVLPENASDRVYKSPF